MAQHRTCHSAEFKAKIALAALSESRTIAQLASEYALDPAEISGWKQELIDNAADLFKEGRARDRSLEAEIAELRHQLSRLEVENDYCFVCPC